MGCRVSSRHVGCKEKHMQRSGHATENNNRPEEGRNKKPHRSWRKFQGEFRVSGHAEALKRDAVDANEEKGLSSRESRLESKWLARIDKSAARRMADHIGEKHQDVHITKS